MNNISQLKILAAGSLAFIANLVSAQTWQTVDDFQYIAGRESQAYGVVAAPSGTIFVCGNGDATSGYHGLVLAGSNGGAIGSWSEPLDDFVYPSTTVGRYEAASPATRTGTCMLPDVARPEFTPGLSARARVVGPVGRPLTISRHSTASAASRAGWP